MFKRAIPRAVIKAKQTVSKNKPKQRPDRGMRNNSGFAQELGMLSRPASYVSAGRWDNAPVRRELKEANWRERLTFWFDTSKVRSILLMKTKRIWTRVYLNIYCLDYCREDVFGNSSTRDFHSYLW